MATHLFKFTAVWLVVALLVGAGLYFASGSSDSLNPSLEASRLANCQDAGGGFSGDQAQECLSQVQRSLTNLAEDTRSDLIYWHALTSLVVLLVGLGFILQIVQRGRTAGVPAEFRSMRGTWFVYLMIIIGVVILFGVLAHFTEFFGLWGVLLDPARGWGIPAAMLVVWVFTYWLGSRVASPDKMKPSIPGG